MHDSGYYRIFAAITKNKEPMKRLLALVLAVMPLCAMAQNYNEDGGKYEVYCDVKYFVNALSKTTINIVINDNKYTIIDKEGKEIKTKEITTILNCLSKRGWKLISSFGTTGGSNLLPYERHYTMMKIVTNDKEIEEGIKLDK